MQKVKMYYVLPGKIRIRDINLVDEEVRRLTSQYLADITKTAPAHIVDSINLVLEYLGRKES